MTRVKRGVKQHARRERILKHTKGFKWRRKTHLRQAKEALLHAWAFQFADRKKKKRDFRRLWNVRISAAAKENGTSYSKLIHRLKIAKIELDRKILSDLAANNPEVFKKILQTK